MDKFKDRYILLKGKCSYCENESEYSLKISNNPDVVDIGGLEKYNPVCRECFSNIKIDFIK